MTDLLQSITLLVLAAGLILQSITTARLRRRLTTAEGLLTLANARVGSVEIELRPASDRVAGAFTASRPIAIDGAAAAERLRNATQQVDAQLAEVASPPVRVSPSTSARSPDHPDDVARCAPGAAESSEAP